MSATNRLVRAAIATAGTGALVVAMAGPAAAHHCWRDWQGSAHEQLAAGGTAWVTMTDFVVMGLGEEGLPEACLAHAGEWTAAWMESHDVEDEPLVHSRATVGGGAAHKKGKEPGHTNYLGDADFNELIGYAMAEPDCAPPTEE